MRLDKLCNTGSNEAGDSTPALTLLTHHSNPSSHLRPVTLPTDPSHGIRSAIRRRPSYHDNPAVTNDSRGDLTSPHISSSVSMATCICRVFQWPRVMRALNYLPLQKAPTPAERSGLNSGDSHSPPPPPSPTPANLHQT